MVKIKIQPQLYEKNFREQIYEYLKNIIVKGEIHEGYMLKETELATQFNVSRMPVREALHRLDAEGLIEQTPMYGYRVVTLTSQDVTHIFSIRKSLEGLAAAYACKHSTETEIYELKELVQKGKRLFADKPEDIAEQLILLTQEFNTKFINSCRVPQLIKIILNQYEFLVRFHIVNIVLKKRGGKMIDDREKLVEALEKRDSKMARQVWEAHLHSSILAYLESLDIELDKFDYI